MLRFLSIVTLSQATLVAQQLLILPLQIHVWGHDTVAVWLAALALAAIVGSSDLGLKNAGFAAIAAGETGDKFATLWSVMRLQMLAAGLVTMGVSFAMFSGRIPPDQSIFLVILTAAAMMENYLGLRTPFLEALGRIAYAESAFLAMVATRLVVGVALIYFLHAGPVILSILWLASACMAVLIQAQFREVRTVAPLFRRWKFSHIRETYADARWSAATPLVVWAQIHLPVITLSSFAPAAIVSSFVALRTLYGLTRLIIQQISRIISIQYTRRVRQIGADNARAFLLLVAAGVAWLSAGAGLAIFAEKFWLTGPLFDIPKTPIVYLLILTLGISSTMSVHQLFALSMAREGAFSTSGTANYAYFLGVAGTCGLALLLKNMPLLVIGLAACDVMLLALIVHFFLRGERGPLVRKAVPTFVLGMGLWVTLVGGGWSVLTRFGHPDLATPTFATVAQSMAIAFAAWLVGGAIYWTRAWPQSRAA